MSNELSILELDAERAELLPAREALGVVKFNLTKFNTAFIGADNTSLAFNGGGAFSFAEAGASQSVVLLQH